MSLNVVIKGPEAAAGLMSNLSKTMGVIVPDNDASKTTQVNAMATINEMSKSPLLK